MNAMRREDVRKALKLLEQAQAILEQVRDEEQESYDNLPEGIQMGERGETMEETISYFEEYLDNISDMVEFMETV